MKNKGQIRNNILQYVVFTLIVKKSNEDLCVYVNYKDFNALTIKNRNILSLI